MPLVEGYVTNLTPRVASELKQAITAAIAGTLARNFPLQLGFVEGSPEHAIASGVVAQAAPGWIWVTVHDFSPSVAGSPVTEGVAGRFNALVLEEALGGKYLDEITNAIADAARGVLGTAAQPVQLAISVDVGHVRMSVPGMADSLLTADAVHQFLLGEIVKALQSEGAGRKAA